MKCSLTFYQRSSFTKTLHMSVLLDGRHSYINTFQRNSSSKKCRLFFCSVYKLTMRAKLIIFGSHNG